MKDNGKKKCITDAVTTTKKLNLLISFHSLKSFRKRGDNQWKRPAMKKRGKRMKIVINIKILQLKWVNVDNIFHVIISLLRKVFFHIFGVHYHFFIFRCFGFWLWFFWLFLIRSFLVYGRRIDYSSRD